MRKLILIVFLLGIVRILPAQQLYFPPNTGNEWETLALPEMGWCSSEVDKLYQFLDDNSTKSFILLKDGKIVLEKYFGTFAQDSSWIWYSAGKSLTSMLVGIAQQEGYLDINQPTSTYLGTAWTSMDANQEQAITVRHQLTMTSGIEESDMFCTLPSCLQYTADPGTRWYYHNGPYSLLSDVVEKATGKGYNVFTYQAIQSKIGMKGLWLPVGYNHFYISTARDMARYGLLILNKGVWQGDSVLKDPDYFEAMTNSSQELNPSYGYLWWLNGKSSFIPPGTSESFSGSIAPEGPKDLILAAGAEGQFISVSADRSMVMIRQGTLSNPDYVPMDFHNGIWEHINQLTCPMSVDERQSSSFKVFPNPATDYIQIEHGNLQRFWVDIYSASSQLVYQGENTNHISTQRFPDGLYHLKLRTEQAIEYHKILIK